jgi:hypothetical protein
VGNRIPECIIVSSPVRSWPICFQLAALK